MRGDALAVAAASMASHRCFDPGIETSVHANTITVAANPEPMPCVFIHGRAQHGFSIGGLFTPDDARALIASLTEAIEYAEGGSDV